MPQAIPLPRNRYVQYLESGPEAPRREIARTHEIKGQQRHGLGVAYRLFGRHAVVLGRWSPEALTPTEMTLLKEEFPDWDGDDFHDLIARIDQEDDEEETENWPRLITAEEADTLRERFAESVEKVRVGWLPPRWHWRRYFNKALPWLHRNYLVVSRPGEGWRPTPRRFLSVMYWRFQNLFVDKK